MAITKKYTEKIISPLEFRHFVLDIPRIAEKYQKEAVLFALKSYYPGTDKNTSIDYAYKNSKVIGIAVNSDKLKLVTENSRIISPTLVVLESFNDGLIINCSKDWIELLFLKNGEIIALHSFTSKDYNSVLNKISDIQKNSTLDIKIIRNNCDITNILNFIRNEGFCFSVEEFDTLLKKIPHKKIYLFTKKKSRSSTLIYFITLCFISLLLTTTVLITHAIKKKYTLILNDIKTEYSNALQVLQKNNAEYQNIEYYEIKSCHSIYELLSEITNTSENLVITSFTYSNNTIRFEAENSNAIRVLEKLQKSDIIYDVTLLQSIPRDNGNEKFIITGKIR